jgi:hypothetical protein
VVPSHPPHHYTPGIVPELHPRSTLRAVAHRRGVGAVSIAMDTIGCGCCRSTRVPPHEQLLVRLGAGGVLSGAVLGRCSRHRGCQELISKSFVSNRGMGDKEKNSPMAQETSTSLGPFFVFLTIRCCIRRLQLLSLSSPSSCATAVFVHPSPSPSPSSYCGGCPRRRVASLLSCCGCPRCWSSVFVPGPCCCCCCCWLVVVVCAILAPSCGK